jgi:hypothetical protein
VINPNVYYTVQAWMITDLGLRGNELTAYAIIYGFSQDGRSEFVGSISYFEELLVCSRPTAVKTLATLEEKGLITKRVARNGMNCNAYRAWPTPQKGSKETLPEVVKNFNQGSKETLPEVVKNFNQGSKETLPNNYINNNSNNYIDKDIPPQAAPTAPAPSGDVEVKTVKHKYGEYKNVLLTDKELDKLKAEYPADWEIRIERLSEYIASKGAKYKSHYATIRAWANRDKKQTAPAARGKRQAVGPNGIAINPNKTDLDAYFLEAAT